MDESGKVPRGNFFADLPESARPGRQLLTGSAAPAPGRMVPLGMTGAELRLSVWSELSERHRNEVCRQIRKRCETFIASIRLERHEREAEIDRLVSEVVAHLLRATSVPRDETPMDPLSPGLGTPEAAAYAPPRPLPWLARGLPDEQDPPRDARVGWVIEDTCNRQALFHRFEDMRRRDHGGKWDGSGYPLVTVDDQTIEHYGGHYDPAEDETDALHVDDSRRAWDGLIKLVAHQFGPGDDVVALVRVLGEDPEAQESFGSQWPIGKIVRALNRRRPDMPWNDDRVENAKRRLTRCIVRIKQAHGLDAVDLRALLARYARQHRQTAEGPRAMRDIPRVPKGAHPDA